MLASVFMYPYAHGSSPKCQEKQKQGDEKRRVPLPARDQGGRGDSLIFKKFPNRVKNEIYDCRNEQCQNYAKRKSPFYTEQPCWPLCVGPH